MAACFLLCNDKRCYKRNGISISYRTACVKTKIIGFIDIGTAYIVKKNQLKLVGRDIPVRNGFCVPGVFSRGAGTAEGQGTKAEALARGIPVVFRGILLTWRMPIGNTGIDVVSRQQSEGRAENGNRWVSHESGRTG